MSDVRPIEDIIREVMGKRLEVVKDRLKKEDLELEGLAKAPGNRLRGHAITLIEYITRKSIPQGSALEAFQRSLDNLQGKAFPQEGVPLAVHALATVAVYHTVAPLLSPACPQDYQAQVDALSYVLSLVLDLIESRKPNEDIYSQLTDMVAVRLVRFAGLIDMCQGAGLRPDAWQGAGLTGPLRDYYAKLFAYVYNMAGKDIYVPLALNALGSIYTHLIAGRPYAGRCPDLLLTYLKGLERIVEDVVTLLHGKPINFTGKVRPWLTDLIGLRLKHFLEFIAYCRGLDVRLSVELGEGEGLPEVTLLRVSPVRVLPVAGGGTP